MTYKRTLEDWEKTGLSIKHISREALAIDADLSYRFGKTHRDCKKWKEYASFWVKFGVILKTKCSMNTHN